MNNEILQIKDLTIKHGDTVLVDDVNLSLGKGETLAIVGESGSGKTLTAMSILNLLPEGLVRQKGIVSFKDSILSELSYKELRSIRGNDISMVFQEPFLALNPVLNIGVQLRETFSAHRSGSKSYISELIIKRLDMLKLPRNIINSYPHELSGGMRQRVLIAMALICVPDILILDEPTTALDVSIQRSVLDMIKNIRDDRNISIIFITHDFSVVKYIADKVCVMKDGRIVEMGDIDRIINSPEEVYTRCLLECIPKLGDERKRLPVFNSR